MNPITPALRARVFHGIWQPYEFGPHTSCP